MFVFVYFIEAQEVGRIKIGISHNPETRMRYLQNDNPCHLKLIRTILCRNRQDAVLLEAAFHKMFKGKRFNHEWFSVAPDIALASVDEAINSAGIYPPQLGFNDQSTLNDRLYALDEFDRMLGGDSGQDVLNAAENGEI